MRECDARGGIFFTHAAKRISMLIGLALLLATMLLPSEACAADEKNSSGERSMSNAKGQARNMNILSSRSKQQPGLSEIDLPPLLGNMGGIELAFPRTEHGFPAIHYEGHPGYWEPGKFIPTQNSRILDFKITVRLSNFKPVMTWEDLNEFASRPMGYGDHDLPPDRDRWIDVSFSPSLFKEDSGNLKVLFEQHLKDAESKFEPFLEKTKLYSLKQVSSNREGELWLVDMFLYDDVNWTTFMECTRATNNPPQKYVDCDHYFVVPELKSIALAKLHSTEDISHWQKIESEIKTLINSYIVSPPTVLNK